MEDCSRDNKKIARPPFFLTFIPSVTMVIWPFSVGSYRSSSPRTQSNPHPFPKSSHHAVSPNCITSSFQPHSCPQQWPDQRPSDYGEKGVVSGPITRFRLGLGRANLIFCRLQDCAEPSWLANDRTPFPPRGQQ